MRTAALLEAQAASIFSAMTFSRPRSAATMGPNSSCPVMMPPTKLPTKRQPIRSRRDVGIGQAPRARPRPQGSATSGSDEIRIWWTRRRRYEHLCLMDPRVKFSAAARPPDRSPAAERPAPPRSARSSPKSRKRALKENPVFSRTQQRLCRQRCRRAARGRPSSNVKIARGVMIHFGPKPGNLLARQPFGPGMEM